MKINVVTNLHSSILERERPSKSTYKWAYSSKPESADVYVVYGLTRELEFPTVKSPKIFVCVEPPEIAMYDLKVLRKYALVLAPAFPYLSSLPNHRVSAGLLNWSIGSRDHVFKREATRKIPGVSELLRMKTGRSVTMIVSNKKITKMQKERLNFSNYLKEKLESFELYGRNIKQLDDKMSVLAPNSFHIAIENSQHPGYWTEKLADPIICLNRVFYVGDPTIAKTFHSDCVTELPFNDFSKSLNLIQSVMSTPLTKEILENIIYARQQILTSMNIHCAIERNLDNLKFESQLETSSSKIDSHRLSFKSQAGWILDALRQRAVEFKRHF
jgi:hypothetical protein